MSVGRTQENKKVLPGLLRLVSAGIVARAAAIVTQCNRQIHTSTNTQKA